MKKIIPSKYLVKIGIYYVGSENVAIYLRSGTGGEFSLAPKDDSQAFIAVGHYDGKGDWTTIVNVLQHELLEFSMARLGLRWVPAPGASQSHAGYSFHMTHEQLDEVACMTGACLAACLPEMSKHYKIVVKAAK